MSKWPQSIFKLPTPDYGDYAEVDIVKDSRFPISIKAGQNDWEVSGTTYLTPSQARRLARLLNTAADEAQCAAGKTMSGVNTESGSPGAPEPLGGDPHA